MINQQDAEVIATEILRRPPADASRPWQLREFDQGWLIQEAPPPGEARRGGSRRVIERATGQVVRFPSSVPPGRITEEYSEVRDYGRVEPTER